MSDEQKVEEKTNQQKQEVIEKNENENQQAQEQKKVEKETSSEDIIKTAEKINLFTNEKYQEEIINKFLQSQFEESLLKREIEKYKTVTPEALAIAKESGKNSLKEIFDYALKIQSLISSQQKENKKEEIKESENEKQDQKINGSTGINTKKMPIDINKITHDTYITLTQEQRFALNKKFDW